MKNFYVITLTCNTPYKINVMKPIPELNGLEEKYPDMVGVYEVPAELRTLPAQVILLKFYEKLSPESREMFQRMEKYWNRIEVLNLHGVDYLVAIEDSLSADEVLKTLNLPKHYCQIDKKIGMELLKEINRSKKSKSI